MVATHWFESCLPIDPWSTTCLCAIAIRTNAVIWRSVPRSPLRPSGNVKPCIEIRPSAISITPAVATARRGTVHSSFANRGITPRKLLRRLVVDRLGRHPPSQVAHRPTAAKTSYDIARSSEAAATAPPNPMINPAVRVVRDSSRWSGVSSIAIRRSRSCRAVAVT